MQIGTAEGTPLASICTIPPSRGRSDQLEAERWSFSFHSSTCLSQQLARLGPEEIIRQSLTSPEVYQDGKLHRQDQAKR